MADERAKEAREAAAEPEESAPSGGPRGEGDTPQTPTGPAAADTRRPTRRGRVRRWVRRLALLALTCTLLAGALYLGREFTLHPLAARLAPVLTPLFSDYEVEVRRIRGDWFTELRFEGLQLRSEVAPLRWFEAEAIGAEYSVLDLLRGAPDWLHRIDGHGLHVEVELEEGAADDGDRPASAVPARLPLADLKDLSLDLRRGGREVRLRQLALVCEDVPGADGRSEQELSLTLERVEVGAARERDGGTGDDVWVARHLAAHLRYRSGEVWVDSIDLSGRPLIGASRADLRGLGEGVVSWELQVVGIGAPLSFDGSLAGGVLRAEIWTAGLRLEAAAELLGTHAPEHLSGALSVQGNIELPLAEPFEARGDLDFDLVDLRLGNFSADRLRATAAVGDERIAIALLELRDGPNTIVGTDLVIPLVREYAQVARGLAGRVEIDARDVGRLVRGTPPAGEQTDPGPGQQPSQRPVPEHRLLASVRLEEGVAHVDSGRMEIPRGQFHLRGGEVHLIEAARGRWVRLELEADVADLAPLGEILQTRPWSGSLEGAMHIEGHLPAVEGDARLTGRDVVVAGFPLGAIELEAHGTRERIVIDALAADGDNIDLDLSGSWDLATGRMHGVLLTARVTHLEQWSDLLHPGGSLALSASLDGDPRAPTGRLDLTGVGVRAGGVDLSDLELSARAADGLVHVERLHCAGPRGVIDSVLSLRLPDGATPLEIRLDSLSITRDGKGLALREPVVIELGEERIVARDIALAGSAGELTATAVLYQSEITADVVAHALDLTPFLSDLMPEGAALRGIEADLHVRRQAGLLVVSGEADVASWKPAAQEPEYTLSVKGKLEGGRLELERLSAVVLGETVVDLTVSLPLDPLAASPLVEGPLSVHGSIGLPRERSVGLRLGARSLSLAGGVQGRIELTGNWRSVRGRIELEAQAIQVGAADLDLAAWMPEPARFALALDIGDTVTLERFEVEVPGRGRVDLSGTLDAPLDVLALTAGDQNGDGARIGAQALDLVGFFVLEDIGWLATRSDDLRRLAGRVGGTIAVGGSLADPEVRADLTLEEGELRLGNMPLVQKLALELSLRDRRLEVVRLEGTLGAALFHIGGSLDLGGQTTAEPVLDLSLKGKNLLLARSSMVRLRADMDLAVTGPLSALTASGRVTLRHSRLLQNFDFMSWTSGGRGGVASVRRGLSLPSFRSPPLSDMTFDVDVDTREPLEIHGNLVRADVRLALKLVGTGEVLTPVGQAFLDETRVALPGGSLKLTAGIVRFEAANPFVPFVDVIGETRRAGYDLRVHVTGPYDEPEVELSSTPSLSQDELLHLFLTGRLPVAGEAWQGAAESMTVYIAKDVLRSLTSSGTLSESDEESFVERFELVTGRELSKGGLSTFEAKFRILDGLVSKRDSLHLVGERDVYEDYNYGVRLVFKFR